VSDAPIRVLLVDDHALVREGIRQALLGPEFEVVGEAGNGTDALALAQRLRPDLVVLDISLPGESGIKTAARLRTETPEVRVLMLSVHDHPEYILESARAGAHGYLRKDTLPEELRDAIRTVHEGRTAFADFATRGSEPLAPVSGADVTQRLDLLTRRERDVLVGVASGFTNKEIAARYGLSVRTVESYRESLMQKLGIRTIAGLTRFALDARLIGG
jgi:two-component system, NarL family, nitrate/nitrite response regulator NarL